MILSTYYYYCYYRYRHVLFYRSPQYSFKIQNEWSYTSLPLLCLHVIDSNLNNNDNIVAVVDH